MSRARIRPVLLLFPSVPMAPVLLGPVLLGLAACGDGRSGAEKSDASPVPLGFELALSEPAAKTPAGAAEPTPDAAATAAPMIDLTPEQLAARLTAGNIRLIDVRTAEEVAEGMIPGAEHIPLDAFDPAKLGPPDGREVVLYCRSDRRSAVAAAKLAEATGEPATHLEGGILAWEAAGQPVEKP